MSERQPDMLRFSAWMALDQDTSVTGLVQLKVLDKLVSYPTGKSAMIWYGTNLDQQAFERAMAQGQAQFPKHTLLWRTLPQTTPQPRLLQLLHTFHRRFGAYPLLNEEG